jgi:hypothetical protein
MFYVETQQLQLGQLGNWVAWGGRALAKMKFILFSVLRKQVSGVSGTSFARAKTLI